jgi:predicted  nucleic acid-binding Zn-ribbon protein
MPSASDFFQELQGANSRLEQVKTQLTAIKSSVDDVKDATDAVKTSVQQVNSTLSTGFSQLIVLGTYTNDALAHNAKQNDTIICLLDKIARNTCTLVNSAAEQTALQRSLEATNRMLAELYAATHAEAAHQREQHDELRKQIERCCPPPQPQPPCRYEPCEAPGKLKEPPRVSGSQPPVG